MEWRLRRRLERWRLPELLGVAARRVAQNLQRLPKLVPPRLRAAMLSTIFNRWTTDRRMRSLRGGRRVCVLGCSCTADDSVEHYVHCAVGRAWSRTRLCSDDAGPAMARGVLATTMTDVQLQREAVRNYVLYRAVNDLRRREFATLEERAVCAKMVMNQLLYEATRDDSRLRKLCRCPEGLTGRVRRRDDGAIGRRGRRRA